MDYFSIEVKSEGSEKLPPPQGDTVQPKLWGKSCAMRQGLPWNSCVGEITTVLFYKLDIPFSSVSISPPPHSQTREEMKHGWVWELALQRGDGPICSFIKATGRSSKYKCVDSDECCWHSWHPMPSQGQPCLLLHSPPAPTPLISFPLPFPLSTIQKKGSSDHKTLTAWW